MILRCCSGYTEQESHRMEYQYRAVERPLINLDFSTTFLSAAGGFVFPVDEIEQFFCGRFADIEAGCVMVVREGLSREAVWRLEKLITLISSGIFSRIFSHTR